MSKCSPAHPGPSDKAANGQPAWVDPPVAPDVSAEYWHNLRTSPSASAGTGDGGVNAAPRVDSLFGPAAWDEIWASLSQRASSEYSARWREQMVPQLFEFEHGPATYLFDKAVGPRAERTLLVLSHPQPPGREREATYQAGYPLLDQLHHRPVDRGHFVPHSGGGLFGPNMFVQDRALNRGWSRQGRLYRALERRAVSTTDAVLFARPIYDDETDIPVTVDLGVIDDTGRQAYRFRNRYDPRAQPNADPDAGPSAGEPTDDGGLGAIEDELVVALNGAMNSQIGALGEETAAEFLASELEATIVALGDAGMPRQGAAQDLDIVAIVDGELIAFEVKTRYLAKAAGRHTRAGNLTRPRMRRPDTPNRPRQGSQDYVAERLGQLVHLEGFAGIEVRVLAVDLCLMEIQQFTISDTGTRLTPLGAPASCLEAARIALTAILDHRGYL